MTDPVHALLGENFQWDRNSKSYYPVPVQKMAEEIHRIWPNLQLAWIPFTDRGPRDEFPYALFETDALGQQHLVCNCTEAELPLLMERIWDMDQSQHNILSEMDKINAKNEKARKDKAQDKLLSEIDRAYHILKGKYFYKDRGKTYK